jgi:hypothetical protein
MKWILQLPLAVVLQRAGSAPGAISSRFILSDIPSPGLKKGA